MAKHIRASQLQKLTAGSLTCVRSTRTRDARSFSVLNRPPPNYEEHIPLTITERLGLAVGSGLGSFLDPRRAGECIWPFPIRVDLLTTQISSRLLAKRPHSHTS